MEPAEIREALQARGLAQREEATEVNRSTCTLALRKFQLYTHCYEFSGLPCSVVRAFACQVCPVLNLLRDNSTEPRSRFVCFQNGRKVGRFVANGDRWISVIKVTHSVCVATVLHFSVKRQVYRTREQEMIKCGGEVLLQYCQNTGSFACRHATLFEVRPAEITVN